MIHKTMKKDFPYLDEEGRLHENLPLVRIVLNTGQIHDVNYFFNHWKMFIPHRFLTKTDEFIPVVQYHSQFMSPYETMKLFVTLAKSQMKKNGFEAIQISHGCFVMWSSISKIEILMKQFHIRFDKLKWEGDSKYPIVQEQPKIINDDEELKQQRQIKVDEITANANNQLNDIFEFESFNSFDK